MKFKVKIIKDDTGTNCTSPTSDPCVDVFLNYLKVYPLFKESPYLTNLAFAGYQVDFRHYRFLVSNLTYSQEKDRLITTLDVTASKPTT